MSHQDFAAAMRCKLNEIFEESDCDFNAEHMVGGCALTLALIMKEMEVEEVEVGNLTLRLEES